MKTVAKFRSWKYAVGLIDTVARVCSSIWQIQLQRTDSGQAIPVEIINLNVSQNSLIDL